MTTSDKQPKNPAKSGHVEKPANLAAQQTAITVSGSGGPVSLAPGAVFHDGDLRPAMVKLIQPTSATGTPGSLYRTDTEEEFPELVVVPLKIQAVRTKWPGDGGFSRDRFPECVSYDGIRSITRFSDGRTPRFVDQPCNTCEFYTTAPWSVSAGEEFCQPGYSVLVMDAESFEVYGMRLHGTSSKVARMLGSPPHLRKTVLRLWGDKVSSDRGTWFQLKATPVRKLTEDELAFAEQQYAAYGIGLDDS